MFSNYGESSQRRCQLLTMYASLAWLVFLVISPVAPAHAQCNFNSGSTGADGAFAPTANQTVQVPESGVFNYTTINIPSGVTIKFARNSRNTPITILASGNVTIVGTIDVSGGPGAQSVFGAGANSGAGIGGPGGFDGGRGGFSFSPFFTATAGDGPGGGVAGNSAFPLPGGGGGFGSAGGTGGSGNGLGGLVYGTRTLIPLIGGSGGGGGPGTNGIPGIGGGGGAGAILIASSGTIISGNQQGFGSITARGGDGPQIGNSSVGGGGSGGAIRLIANTITGNTSLNVGGGGSGFGGPGFGGHGYIRIEACDYNGFQPFTTPLTTSTGGPIISLAPPSSMTPPNAPTLKITSVAGITAPAMPNGSFHGTPDIIVPNAQTNPVVVALQASNVPLGTVAQVTLMPESAGSTTVQSTPLAGTVAASTATASVNLPASGLSLVTAQLTFDMPSGQRVGQLMMGGERVKRVEIATSFGGRSDVTYITESGKRIKRTGE